MKTVCMTTAFGRLFISEEKGCIVKIGLNPMELTEGSELLQEAVKQLNEYLEGTRKIFNLPLAIEGTEFQKSVYRAIEQIEYGECVSYKRLAEMAGYPRALRAVGTACGSNPLAIVIGCHRVIRSDGSLGQYAYGSEMKKFLIDLEKGR